MTAHDHPQYVEGCYRCDLSRDEAEEAVSDPVRNAVASVLVNASNFPDKVAPRILGQDMGPLIDKVTGAVASVLSEQGEPEWEYGATGSDPRRVISPRDSLDGALEAQRWWREVVGAPSVVMKRTPGREPGPWLLVE